MTVFVNDHPFYTLLGTLSTENSQTMRLLDLTPDENVAWEWIAQYNPINGTAQTDEWVGTRVSFAIRADPDGSSTLVFTHIGLTPQLVCHEQCNAGWHYYLGSLKKLGVTQRPKG